MEIIQMHEDYQHTADLIMLVSEVRKWLGQTPCTFTQLVYVTAIEFTILLYALYSSKLRKKDLLDHVGIERCDGRASCLSFKFILRVRGGLALWASLSLVVCSFQQ
jgi:hypothetical protein